MSEKQKEVSLYDVLGVKKSASTKQIKDAYKKMAKKTHPDREGGDEEKFKAVSEAYDILTDENKRKHYDATGETRSESSYDKIIAFLVQQIIPAILSAEDVKTVDIIGNIQKYIGIQVEATFENEAHMQKNIRNIGEFIRRLKVKDGEDVENVFDEILKSQKRHMEKELASFPKEREFLAEVQVFIEKYEYLMDNGMFRLNIKNKNDNSGNKKVHLGHEST